MADTSATTTELGRLLALYADGQLAVDELAPQLATYPFADVTPGGSFPQPDTVQELVSFWQEGFIPDDDYEVILEAIPMSEPATR